MGAPLLEESWHRFGALGDIRCRAIAAVYLGATLAPVHRNTQRTTLEIIRSRLDEPALQTARAAGRALPVEQAIAQAWRPPRDPTHEVWPSLRARPASLRGQVPPRGAHWEGPPVPAGGPD